MEVFCNFAFTMGNVAVILAGGTGKRSGLAVAKQFFVVAGKMVIEHTVEAFEKNENIDEIAIVSHKDYISEIEAIVARNGWTKVGKVLEGGKERHDSTLSAVRAYGNIGKEVNLIIHDAARMLVSQRIINDVAAALDLHEAVSVAIPSSDTVYEVTDGIISAIPSRQKMMRAQTPQAFRLSILAEAYALALPDPAFTVTDDAGVVNRYLPNIPIHIVDGDVNNIKLTYKEDIPLIERLLCK